MKERLCDLDAIEARSAAASPAPWRVGDRETGEVWAPNEPVANTLYWPAEVPGSDCDEKNADFIAAARTDVPELVDENRRLRAAIAWIWSFPEASACVKSYNLPDDMLDLIEEVYKKS